MVGTIFVMPRGGLGNLLFNYMIGYVLSKKYNMQLRFISNYNAGSRAKMHTYKMFQTCSFVTNAAPNSVILKEHGLLYQSITIADRQKNYLLNGYFGSYKYSINELPQIKADLIDNHPEYLALLNRYNQLRELKITIAVHVRRGDYLHLKGHIVQPDSYYRLALSTILAKLGKPRDIVRLLVFSDDIPYISHWKVVTGYDHQIITETNPERSFILMSLCDHFIIANSTFSRQHPDGNCCGGAGHDPTHSLLPCQAAGA